MPYTNPESKLAWRRLNYQRRKEAGLLVHPHKRTGGQLAAFLVAKKRHIHRVRAFVLQSKTGKPCMDCGVLHPPYIMEYDHVRGQKKSNLSCAKTIDGARLEMEKCDLVCANCHRERTFKANFYSRLVVDFMDGYEVVKGFTAKFTEEAA